MTLSNTEHTINGTPPARWDASRTDNDHSPDSQQQSNVTHDQWSTLALEKPWATSDDKTPSLASGNAIVNEKLGDAGAIARNITLERPQLVSRQTTNVSIAAAPYGGTFCYDSERAQLANYRPRPRSSSSSSQAPTLQEQLVAQGYRLRTYVPYGDAWYPYLTRRLAERPANLWFFLSNLVRGERAGGARSER